MVVPWAPPTVVGMGWRTGWMMVAHSAAKTAVAWAVQLGSRLVGEMADYSGDSRAGVLVWSTVETWVAT